jgi:hypothetical protein
LLVKEGGPSQHTRQPIAAKVRRRVPRGAGFVKRNVAWIAPVALGALVGVACLLYLRTSRNRGAELNATMPAPVATIANRAVVDASVAAPVAPSAPSQTPAEHAAAVVPPPPSQSSGAHIVRPSSPAVARAVPQLAAPQATAVAKVDHLGLARQAFNERDWPLALAEAKAATATGGADAYALVGSTYFKMGRFADAEKSYAQAVALEPKNSLFQERLRIAHARAEQANPAK